MDYKIKNNLVSIDGNDFSKAFENRQRIIVTIEDSMDTRKIARKIKGASSLVISIQGKKSITIEDCQHCVESLAKHVKRNADIIWGAQIGDRERLMVMAGW